MTMKTQGPAMRNLLEFAVDPEMLSELAGDGADPELLIRSGVKLGIRQAKLYARRYELRHLLDDLTQEAMLGLVWAVNTYRPERDGDLLSHAARWVRLQ